MGKRIIKKDGRQLSIEEAIEMAKKESTSKCWYCKTNLCEERCIYCTSCREAMAAGKIKPNYLKDKICLVCGKDIGVNPISNVVCKQCIDEI